jgi:hypothetical protein
MACPRPVADWQRSLRKLFEIAGLKDAHPYASVTRSRSNSCSWAPIDQVSILFAYSSVKITEKSYAPWVKARARTARGRRDEDLATESHLLLVSVG